VSPEGYRNRLYAIEWHGRLWHRYGADFEYCEVMIRHCSECLSADYYSEPRPVTTDLLIAKMEAYLDRLFAQANPLVSFA
jgi:hypothetical protein